MVRRVGNVTQRSLSKQLHQPEDDGIVHRHVYAVVPPRVEYSLTDKRQAPRCGVRSARVGIKAQVDRRGLTPARKPRKTEAAKRSPCHDI
ncbi:MAG: winged helix-turn-helix transcriptional regulator [Pseudomonadota bacterium]